MTVYVVLRIANSSEQSLKEYLPRIGLKLDVWAVGNTEGDDRSGLKSETSGLERDLVFSNEVKKVDDPLIVLNREDEEENEPVVLAIWETEAILNRPRARFTSPALTFIASANLLPPNITAEDSLADDYLPSFTPAPANLFEQLKHIPALKNDPPYLPASRLDRVLPGSPADGGVLRIRHATPRATRVVQAVSARIRYSRLDTFSAHPATIASLDFEVTRYMDLTVKLEAAEVVLLHGRAEMLTRQSLPMSCRPRDVVTFLFKLHPASSFEIPSLPHLPSSAAVNGPTADTISIATLATIELSDTCKAKISMAWNTNIDLSAPLNPNFGPPSQTLQRANRPRSLPVAAPNSNIPPGTASVTTTPRSSTIAIGNLTLSFSGPPTPVEVGKTFVWEVLVVNHSSKPAKLAMVPMTQIQRAPNQSQQFNKRHAPQLSTSSTNHAEKRHTNGGPNADIALAICDENIIYALQHQNPQGAETELLSLTPELRIGPLASGTCHEAEIRLLALRAGALRVEAIRVVDLVRESEEGASAPGVMMDIRELPDILAIDSRQDIGSSTRGSRAGGDSD